MVRGASNLQWMGQMSIFNERVLGNLNLNLFAKQPKFMVRGA